jgi:sulfur carrier protein ThiS
LQIFSRPALRFGDMSEIRVHLSGHLSWYEPQKRSWITLDLPEPLALHALLHSIGVPAGDVAFATLNGRMVALDEAARPGDRVEFYPPVGGG